MRRLARSSRSPWPAAACFTTTTRCRCATSSRRAAAQLARCAPTSPRASRRPRSCPSSARRSATSKARLDNLKAVLPEEKDAADLLRRMQTVATQSNLDDQELQAGADRHQAAARRVADQPRARRHVSQPRDLLRPRRQVHAHREHQRLDVKGKDKPGRQLDDHRHVRGDDVRAARQAGRPVKPAAKAGGACPRRRARSHANAPPDRPRVAFAGAMPGAQTQAPPRRPAPPRSAAAPGTRARPRRRPARLHVSARRPARSVPQPARHRQRPRATKKTRRACRHDGRRDLACAA